MAKSKNLIERQSKKKNGSELVETIIQAKKNDAWNEVASMLSGPSRKMPNINLGKINESIEGEKTLVVPGKVLSEGEMDKKTKVVALKFSSKAEEKLSNAGCEINSIEEEIKSNPEGKNIKIIGKWHQK